MGVPQPRAEGLHHQVRPGGVQPVQEGRGRRGDQAALRVHHHAAVHAGQEYHVQYDVGWTTVSRTMTPAGDAGGYGRV